jgi:hypothetical protein
MTRLNLKPESAELLRQDDPVRRQGFYSVCSGRRCLSAP